MAVTKSSNQVALEAATPRGTRFPAFDLSACVEVPRVLHMKGGGQATPDQLAAHLGYKGTNNGSFLTKVGATTLFGLIGRNGPVYAPTPLAHRILSPTYPHDMKKALVEAFFNVPLFKKIYDDFKGKELPPEFGMKNALRLTYGVSPNRVADAYRALMESADTVGFFETKNGARTHLIMPLIQPVPGAAVIPPGEEKPREELGGRNGGGDGSGGTGGGAGGAGINPNPSSLDAVKASYVQSLVDAHTEKVKKGELDDALMTRIEKLLGMA